MKKYFKVRTAGKTLDERVWTYVEFTDNWATRQVEIYENGKEYFADSPDDFFPDVQAIGLIDQPLNRSLNIFTPETEITSEEFEKVWKTQENNPRAMPKIKLKR